MDWINIGLNIGKQVDTYKVLIIKKMLCINVEKYIL